MAKIRVHELAKEFGIASKEMATKIMEIESLLSAIGKPVMGRYSA